MASVPETDIRARLAELGERRQQMEDQDAELAAEIREALAAAKGHVSTTEAATLLKMHRTTIYRVYGDD
jgi:transcriptional regulator of acetoin/glycerol metabolism